ncbi:MAG TPA: MBOAT family O-acyltransferase [Candidatus Saccharimonadales bacterium]|nr:MBOAT family O-acyltransferase [Candidatus Saccharimonadales bacterium]
MLFNSVIFIFIFLPVTYAVFWALPSKNFRYAWLALSGYIFYGYWSRRYCLLMAFATLVSYLAGLGFLRWGNSKRIRKWLLVGPITVELGLLAYFKYTDFGIHTINAVLSWHEIEPLPLLNIILPIGISFYIFHTISYIVDCYLEVIEPTRNPLKFACYVSLFSQLVAGPIVRFTELKSDLEKIDAFDRRSFLDRGWSFFAIGLIQKVLIADTIAAIIDPALLDIAQLSTVGAWMCMLGYTYQIYFDFSGYSNMAIGLGLLFGLHIPQNFNSPYRALNPADFWRRWHMSLSRCFRDYVYVPMAGRRPSKTRLAWVTLATMTLCGLWHGANWTFVIWGAYHGVLLVLYLRYGVVWDAMPAWLQRTGTFFLVLIGLTMFRAPNWEYASAILSRMVVPHTGAELVGGATLTVMLIIAAGVAHVGPNAFELSHDWSPPKTMAIATLFVLCLFSIYGANQSPFLYFQF